jgi:hypothetical protein
MPGKVSNRVFSLSAWFEVRTVREMHTTTFPVRKSCARSAIQFYSSLAVNDRLGNEKVSTRFAFLAVRTPTGPCKLRTH